MVYLPEVYPGYTTVVDPRATFLFSGLSYNITLDMCTLGTQPVVDPRYICYLLISSYCITLEMCTLGAHTVLDPRYSLLAPAYFLIVCLTEVNPW